MRKCNVLLAPNAFKESMSAQMAAEFMAMGAKKSGLCQKIFKVPLSDGGDGLLDFFKGQARFKTVGFRAKNPLGKTVPSTYGILKEKTAVIEMALCSGLQQIPKKDRNAMEASSYGLGEAVKHAYKKGIRKFLIGVGGSASTDGGMGMLMALGARFYNASGALLSPGGNSLEKISRIDLKNLIAFKAGQIEVACDVSNPLYGKKGAACVYGSQKSADATQVLSLDKGLKNFAAVSKQYVLDANPNIPGSGAAGGTAFGLRSFLNGELKPGARLILDSSPYKKYIKKSHVIITAEGALDGQSAFGKVPGLVCELGYRQKVPVLALAGFLGEGWEQLYKLGLKAAFSIQPGPLSLANAIKQGPENLQRATEQLIRTYMASR